MESVKEFLIEIFRSYADIPEEEIDTLLTKVRIRSLDKNSYFLHQGDKISSFGLIQKGLFRVYCTDMAGNDKTLSFRRAGQFLAGYSPYIEKKEIWYSIQALEKAEIISFSFHDYQELLNGNPCWNELSKNYITELFIEKEERERSFLLDNASTRYLHFLKKYPGYENQISQYHIASYLGITPVSLSRIRSQIKKSQNLLS